MPTGNHHPRNLGWCPEEPPAKSFFGRSISRPHSDNALITLAAQAYRKQLCPQVQHLREIFFPELCVLAAPETLMSDRPAPAPTNAFDHNLLDDSGRWNYIGMRFLRVGPGCASKQRDTHPRLYCPQTPSPPRSDVSCARSLSKLPLRRKTHICRRAFYPQGGPTQIVPAAARTKRESNFPRGRRRRARATSPTDH